MRKDKYWHNQLRNFFSFPETLRKQNGTNQNFI